MQRKVPFTNSQIYHIYNRGVDKRDIFLEPTYYSRFLSTLEHYLKYDYPYSALKRHLESTTSPQEEQEILKQLETRRINPPVDILSLSLMPNHYHLTLKQLVENGIPEFMHRIGTGYTGYFNIRQERTGRLFEATYKAVWIESEQQLLHLNRYQHLNPKILRLSTPQELINYPWSSLSTYLGEIHIPFIKPEIVMSAFKNRESYLEFVLAEIDKFEPLRLEGIAVDDDFGWFNTFHSLKKERQEKLRERYLKTI